MMQKFLRIFALVLTVVVLVTGCNLNDNENSTGGVQGQKIIPVTLTVGKWTNGGIVNGGDEQWFKFTATASTQNVYVKSGSLTNSYLYVYDSSYNQIGDRVHHSGSTGYAKSLSKSLIKGATYYIKVTGYYNDSTGTYWIGFTDSPMQPETVITNLSKNAWQKGDVILPSSGGTGEQWFKFAATASTQNVYVKFSSFTNSYVYVYDGSYNQIGDRVNLSGSTGYVKSLSKSLIKGATYYIKVTGYYNDSTGTYWIGFTDSPMQPETVITNLSKNAWQKGDVILPSSGGTGEQWFKFVATEATQYIYVKFSTFTDSYVRVYDSSYNQIGDRVNLYGNSGSVKSLSKSLTSWETYYIKVTGAYSDSSGSYWIAFNSTGTAPQ